MAARARSGSTHTEYGKQKGVEQGVLGPGAWEGPVVWAALSTPLGRGGLAGLWLLWDLDGHFHLASFPQLVLPGTSRPLCQNSEWVSG